MKVAWSVVIHGSAVHVSVNDVVPSLQLSVMLPE
eukprot:CAMPEP_0178449494 /NCGR_PEP_ID=MMETSP0689_2-20121128/42581_1 /TAXON_ID=160604 /ORGANISM="Amphidinium massartii, Strain CS-259" /LENGTH=33 /DNA_ID= /DNA_START= /DNA_END= /DNA_ORIENTATION=